MENDYSLLDNVSNYQVGCVIQKRKNSKPKKLKETFFSAKKKHTSLKDVGVSKATLVQLLWQRACGIISHMFKGPYSFDLLLKKKTIYSTGISD